MSIELTPYPADEVDRLEAWVEAPHVRRWWKPPWTGPVITALRAGVPVPEWIRPWRIDHQGQPIGYAQDYDVMRDGPVWHGIDGVGPGTRGIDLLIGEAAALNRKLGREAIRALTAKVFEDENCDRVVADPHPDHWGAIIAFQKAGWRERGRHQFPSGPVMILTAAKSVWKG
ncbi:MAG: acetyltransferase [Alphaproteobacteria bacterium]|nr:acetyltransferase [Alphaproteobacteria bacterium]